MFIRTLRSALLAAAEGYPVRTVLGPRQSGKTTLVRDAFPDKTHVSLENPDVRARASEDPRSFFGQFQDGASLGEDRGSVDGVRLIVFDELGTIDGDDPRRR